MGVTVRGCFDQGDTTTIADTLASGPRPSSDGSTQGWPIRGTTQPACIGRPGVPQKYQDQYKGYCRAARPTLSPCSTMTTLEYDQPRNSDRGVGRYEHVHQDHRPSPLPSPEPSDCA